MSESIWVDDMVYNDDDYSDCDDELILYLKVAKLKSCRTLRHHLTGEYWLNDEKGYEDDNDDDNDDDDDDDNVPKDDNCANLAALKDLLAFCSPSAAITLESFWSDLQYL